MRLTLRTLLAWLDDTLSPGEVREIGKQVAESPFAKDLVEKIHKVTRQRRLTVPPRSGSDAVDPNVVAAYLDNELDPDEVTELEKRCLSSDVHLAEVASVHQILSLIGQKAKVPLEARNRMYNLIKGREAVKATTTETPRRHKPEKRLVSEPIPAWVTPLPPQRPLYAQFGPAAGVLALILVLCFAAWKSLFTPEPQQTLVASNVGPEPANPQQKSPSVVVDDDAKTQAAEAGKSTAAGAASGKAADASKADEKGEPKTGADAAEGTKGAIPAGSVGLAKKPTGVLLKYNPQKRDGERWERLTDATGLSDQDRLLSLAPFRSSLELGSAKVDLVGETEVWVAKSAPTNAARLSVSQGRVVLHGTTPALPFELQFGGKTIQVTPQPGAAVGVERLNRRESGEKNALAPVLKFFAAEGPVKLSEGANEATIKGAGTVTYEPGGKWAEPTSKPAPTWVTDANLTPFDGKVGEQFLKFFRPGREIVTQLVEAAADDQSDVSRYAVSALRAVGDVSFIVPLLNEHGKSNSQTVRRAAIQVLRAYLAEGPDAAATLRKQLDTDLGSDLAPIAEKLLVGWTAKEASDETTYSRLVQLLSSTEESEVGVRELALDNLQELTGRDDLDYDPEKPEGKGLKAWKDLLHTHELRAATTASKAAK